MRTADEERAAIVAWLRGLMLLKLANDIESGRHNDSEKPERPKSDLAGLAGYTAAVSPRQAPPRGWR